MSVRKPTVAAFFAGCAVATAARAALPHVLLVKLRRDLHALNAGDHRPLLANYADDAVLRFHEGTHRWSGEYRGKPAIERFLRNFTAAGLQGEIRQLYVAGPPWRMTLIARFDDHATGPDGQQLYRNRTVLLVRSRWGRIVHHEDFYEDTERIQTLETRLRSLGIQPIS
ncbi:MAG: hypothetical protein GEV03_07430 [Streptosporangiales bacterium]|nr:hypothetical protein [Streptosporangiales bacterium]